MTDETTTGAAVRRSGLVTRLRARRDRRTRQLVAQALDPLERRLERQHRRIAAIERRLDERLPEAVQRANRTYNELERLQPQLAGLEQRLEELRQRVDLSVDPGTDEEQQEARRLVDLVRREHEQVRARMAAVSWYEERLRLIEERLAE